MAKKPRFPKKSRMGHLKKDGSENVSSKPTKLRASIKAPVSLREKMTNLWKEFREKEELDESQETLEDAQDFNISNDVPKRSPYEVEGELSELLDEAEGYAEAHQAVSAVVEESENVKPQGEENAEKASEEISKEQKDQD